MSLKMKAVLFTFLGLLLCFNLAAACEDCEIMQGPTEDGLYLDEVFGEGRAYSSSWSSTVAPFSDGIILVVDYRNGSVAQAATLGKFNIRCVRNP